MLTSENNQIHGTGLRHRYISKSQHLQSLLFLGNLFELDFPFPPKTVAEELEQFSSDWKHYNPYKPNNPRKGLSITSLDGGLSGEPDLYSLREYNLREGKSFRERDFNTLTPVYEGCPTIQPLINHFYPHIGRTHFLRLEAGGYFPPHRDGAGAEEPDTFRILVPLLGTHRSNFVFIYDEQRFVFEPGGTYFINTLIGHSLFAFSGSATLLICNVLINDETIRLVKEKLVSK